MCSLFIFCLAVATAAAEDVVKPTFVIIGGGLKGVVAAANLVAPDNEVFILEQNAVLARSWDDVICSRELAAYVKTTVEGGALDDGASDFHGCQQMINTKLERSLVDSKRTWADVQTRLEKLGVRVVTNCAFDKTSMSVNNGALSIGCGLDSQRKDFMLTRRSAGAETLVLVDARAKVEIA